MMFRMTVDSNLKIFTHKTDDLKKAEKFFIPQYGGNTMKMKKTQRAVSIFCTGLMLIPTLFSAQPAKACTGNSYSQTYLDSEVCQVDNCIPLVPEKAFAKPGIQLSDWKSKLKAAGIKKEPSTQQSDQWLLEPDTRVFLLDLTDTTVWMAVTFPSLLPIQDVVQCRVFLAEDLSDDSTFKYAEVPVPDDNVTYLKLERGWIMTALTVISVWI